MRRVRRLFWVLVAIVALLAGATLYKDLTRTKVLLAGDSLMALAGPPAKATLHEHGFSVEVKAAPGTGLIGPQFDWVAVLHGQGTGRSTVVLEFAGNYFAPFYPGVALGSPAYFELWTLRTIQLIKEMTSEGADVYLVLIPRMRAPESDRISQTLNQRYIEIARHDPDHVGCIDGKTPLAGPGGDYAESLPGPGGVAEQVRTADGVHFTPAGSKRFGDAIARQLIRFKGHHPPPCTA